MEVKTISHIHLTIPIKPISFVPSPIHLGFLRPPRRCFLLRARGKKTSNSEPVLKPPVVQEVSTDDDEEDDNEEEEDENEDEFDEIEDDEFEDEDEYLDEGDDEEFDDDEFLEDEEDERELRVGDGGGGGGIALAGTWWDKEALAIAEEACRSFDGTLGIYAFRTLPNSIIRLRLERLTNKSGSPSMADMEAFSTTYKALLDQAELAKTIPEDIYLEVSSPGSERVVRIPEDLNRFKERPMFVKYVKEEGETLSECDGVFRLVSFDMESECCTWGWADVKVNREKGGKGRPLTKKLKDWRLETPFSSLRLVRFYCED